MLSRRVRNAIHRKLLEHGWLVMKTVPIEMGWQNAQAYWHPEYIRRLGFRPMTVVDVGVGGGTPDLYQAFPKAYLVLVEPLEEFFEAARKILAEREGTLIPVALGRQEERRKILVQGKWMERSSFFARSKVEQMEDAASPREIAVTTLDALLAKYAWQPPFGLKIDTEGAELEVIRGARSFLKQTAFVIVETNMLDRFPGTYSFAELIGVLDTAGFRFCDILDIARTPSAEVLFVDLVFRRKSD